MKYKIFHKSKGFTLSEMLVVMITSLIIIGLCFTVIRLIDKYFYSFRNEVENQTRHLSLEYQLWKDFNHYEILELKADRSLFLMGHKDTIVYQFPPNSIIRHKDTIFLKIQKIQFFSRAEAVQSGKVDAIEIVTGEVHSFNSFIFKYPSVFDFNHNNF